MATATTTIKETKTTITGLSAKKYLSLLLRLCFRIFGNFVNTHTRYILSSRFADVTTLCSAFLPQRATMQQ